MWFSLSERRAAYIRRLSAQRKATPEMLCKILRQDRDPEVQIAAAETLALIGDEETLPVLLDSLQGCLTGRSRRRHLALGLLIAAGSVVVGLGALVLQPVIGMWLAETGLSLVAAALVVLALIAVPYHSHYQSRKRVALCALGEAILKVTERTRSTQARQALQPLRTASADYLQCDSETRKASRSIALRVDTLTRELEKLPLPAAAPLTADTLPRPSQPAPVAVETLPRVGA